MCAARTTSTQMTSVSKELRAALDDALHAGAAGGRRRAGLGRRHAQMAAAAARRARRRAAARGRVRLHPGDRPRHAVRLEPGRLHAHLLVLPHRHAAPGAQSHAGRDRRPGHGGARPARRLARRAAPPEAPVVPTDGERCITNIVMMGMGEPLYNFEAVRDALAGRRRTATASASPSAASRCRPPASCR